MQENRIVRGLLLSAFFALGSVACSNPCDDLKDQCNECPKDDDISNQVELSCQVTVALDDDDLCDAALDDAAFKCP